MPHYWMFVQKVDHLGSHRVKKWCVHEIVVRNARQKRHFFWNHKPGIHQGGKTVDFLSFGIEFQEGNFYDGILTRIKSGRFQIEYDEVLHARHCKVEKNESKRKRVVKIFYLSPKIKYPVKRDIL